MDILSLYANDGIVVEDNKIWFFASELSSLIEIDSSTGMARVATVINEYKDSFTFRSIAKYGKYIFIFPYRIDKYVIYDLDNNSYSYERIPEELAGKNWAASCCRVGNILYFAFQDPIVAIFDMERREWNAVTIVENGIDETNKQHWFGDGICRISNELFFPIYRDKMVMKLGLNQYTTSFTTVSIGDDIIKTMATDGTDIWIVTESDQSGEKILQFNSDMEQCQNEYALPNGREFICSKIIVGENYIWTIAGEGDLCLRVDRLTGDVVEDKTIPVVPLKQLLPHWGRALNYGKVFENDNIAIFIHSWSRQIVKINKKNSNVSCREINFYNGDIANMGSNIVSETSFYTLRQYVGDLIKCKEN